jgi:hypothetical protein
VSRHRDYRAHLKTAVATSAAPYGYTLTIWTAGAVTTHEHGIPTATDAFLLLLGAVTGFALTAAIAYGSPAQVFAPHQAGNVRLWGGFHLISVGVSIGATTIVANALGRHVVWLAVGFVATTIYLIVVSAQFTMADSRPSDPLIDPGDDLGDAIGHQDERRVT